MKLVSQYELPDRMPGYVPSFMSLACAVLRYNYYACRHMHTRLCTDSILSLCTFAKQISKNVHIREKTKYINITREGYERKSIEYLMRTELLEQKFKVRVVLLTTFRSTQTASWDHVVCEILKATETIQWVSKLHLNLPNSFQIIWQSVNNTLSSKIR